MITITKIEIQQKNKERYNIYIDQGNGEEYGFSVNEHTLTTHMLKSGMVIDDMEMMEIQMAEERRKAYLQAIHYLSHSMRAMKDVHDYLLKKEHHENVIGEVLHRLQKEGYLNDLEYAKAYVRTHSSLSKKGPVALERELKEKGIHTEYLQESLKEYSEKQRVDNAIILCEKKLSAYKKLSIQEKKQKLEAMLVRKGYPFTIIAIAIAEVDLGTTAEEQEIIISHFHKYHRKYEKYEPYIYRQKMKQALYRKGFSIDDIERVLREQEENK